MIFQPIDHGKTADTVVKTIETLILEGVLRPSDRLPPERELAEKLGVSRPILRDALNELEASGLIRSHQGHGTFIADIMGTIFAEPVQKLIHKSRRAANDLLEFRKLIESVTAEMAAFRATEADREIIRDIIEQMDKAHTKQNVELEAKLDVDLHTAIVEASHNMILLHMMRACYQLVADDIFTSRVRLYDREGSRDRLLAEHKELARAILERRSADAKQIATQHIDAIIVDVALMAGEDARIETARRRLEMRKGDSVSLKT
jgi:GntR family transcriptional regulator, transcriptional repressor for pyruvate dehydrogenase complex